MSVATKSTKFSSGFTPQVIPGIALWLDGADPAGNGSIPANGSILSTWADKSGNSNNATAFTGSASYSQKSVVFTGTQSFTTPLSSVQNNQSGFIVVTLTTNVLVDVLGLRYTSGTTPGIQLVFNGETPSIRAWGGTTVVTGSLVGQNTRIIYGYNFIGGGAVGTNFIYSNGTQTGSNTSTSPVLSGVGTFMIGAYTDSPPSAFEGFNGSINEVILYSVNLTQRDRQQIEGYLALKWGLAASIPATHPHRSIPPFLRAFQPIDIANCQLWLDAADPSTITLSGSNVTQWNDKSGNSTSLTVSTGTPTLSQFNGLPSVYFNGAARMASSNYTRLQGVRHINWFVVANPTSINLNYGLLIGTNYNTNAFTQNDLYITSNAVQVFYRIVAGGASKSVSKSITAGNAMIASSFANLETGAYGAYYNGVGTTATDGPIGTQDSTASSLYVGHDNYPGEAFITGTISECLLYTQALTTSQREAIEGYLAWKWGLRANLPTTQSFARFQPLNPVFTPLAISGAALWFDAADTSTITFSTGSNISLWKDKSGNGYNATHVNSPTYNSSKKVVTFNNPSAQYFTLPDNALPAGNSSYAYFIVFSCFSNGAYGLVGGGNYGSGNQVCATRNDGSGRIVTYWWANDITTTNTMTLNATQICESFYTAGSTRSVSLNFTGSNSGTPGARAQGVSNNAIGKTYASEYHNGTISEIIVYSLQPTLAEQQRIEGYLAAKWGLQSMLPTAHPYKKFGP